VRAKVRATAKAIPAKQRRVLDRLSEHVGVVRYDWATYLALYADAATVETLKAAASPFFASLEDRLRDGVLLSLARLFDPAEHPRQENLTLPTVAALLREFADPSLAARVAERVERAKTLAEPVRRERHERIAHLDAAVALANRVRGDVTHGQIESLLGEVEAVVDLIDAEVFGRTALRGFYSNLARQHVAELVEKLAVVSAMGEGEFADRLSRLPDRSATYGTPEGWR